MKYKLIALMTALWLLSISVFAAGVVLGAMLV
mgnify:CR=1 FL=1